MQQDEEQAIKIRERHRDIFNSTTQKYQGRVLQYYGDGTLSIFNSAIDAVKCGIDMQLAYQLDPKIPVRVGIHTGDIIFSEEDIIGDGVNVASRIESLAVAGSVFISDKVYDEIKNQKSIQTQTIGTFELKNVERPVNVFAISNEGLVVPEVRAAKQLTGTFWAEVQRRGVIRAAVAYIVVALLLILLFMQAQDWVTFPDWSLTALVAALIVGFPVALYMAWNYERSPEGFVRTTSKESWQNPYTGGQRKPLTSNFIIAGLVLVILVMYVYPRYLSSKESDIGAGKEVILDDKSIAVIPFKNLSADEENQYFADGQTEAILNHLAKIADLRVISRTTMMSYSRTAKSIPQIAKELGVRYVLEGSVQKVGQKVRINAQLIDSGLDKHLWSDNFDRDLTDIFSIQTEIAKSVAQELQATITSIEQAALESIPTTDLTAYDFYLKGQDYLFRSRQQEDYRYAMQMFERAVAIDENFTLAWVGLASASRWIYWFHQDRTKEHLEKTKHYLDKAIALDSELLEVQIETGSYYYHCELDYPKALQILNKLKSDYPKNDQLHLWTGAIYRRMGEFEQSLDHLNQAILLNPTSWNHWLDAGGTLTIMRRYTQARSHFENAIDLNPSEGLCYVFLALLHLITGDVEEATALLENNKNIDHPGMYMTRSQSELINRNFEEAISVLKASPYKEWAHQFAYTPSSLQLGLIYYLMSEREFATSYFRDARQYMEEKLVELQDDSGLYSSLGIAYAGLGMTKEALAAGNKALSIMDISVDAWRGFYRELDMAKILVMTGRHNEAIVKLEYLLQQNGYLSVELLKKDPIWDPLREVAAFRELID